MHIISILTFSREIILDILASSKSCMKYLTLFSGENRTNCILRRMETFRGGNLKLFYLPSDKGFCSERKEFVHTLGVCSKRKEFKFFSFRADPFSEGQQTGNKSYLPCKI